MRAGFCGGFVVQWFKAALVRHPGFESHSCQYVSINTPSSNYLYNTHSTLTAAVDIRIVIF